jgi:high-affinity Fe2+/Pb2+ permease
MVSKSELRSKKYLIIGITIGAAFSLTSGFLAIAFFRFIDKLSGETDIVWEGWYLGVSLFAFFLLLYALYMIARDIDKKSK